MKKIIAILGFFVLSIGVVTAQETPKYWLENRIQLDGQTFFGQPDDSKLVGGVTMRRIQAAFNAQLNDWLYGKIEVNFANGKFQLKDAFVRFDTDWFDVTLGNFKEDFSADRVTSSRNIPFMERAMVISAFAPGRHLGAMANFHRGWFRTSLGVSWQAIDSESNAERVDTDSDAGISQGTNFTNKVVFMPWANDPMKGMHIGFNWSYRAPTSAENYTSDFPLRQSSFNRLSFLNTGTIENVAYNMVYGAELSGYYRGVRLMSEFIWNNTYMTEEALNTNTKLFYGGYVQGSFLLFGGTHRYDTAKSVFTKPVYGRSWGDVELMARWDFLQLTDLRGGIEGGFGQNFTLGLVYYITENLRTMVNYTYSLNDEYAVGADNANPLPRNSRFHSLGCRIELWF